MQNLCQSISHLTQRPMSQIRVSELYVYPIKSAAGWSLAAAEVQERGFAFDRRWMVVDDTGKFMTQRKHPKLALLQVAIASKQLRLTAPGLSELVLSKDSTHTLTVEVWGDRCQAQAIHGSQEWLSEYLEQPCQLVYMPNESDRPIHHAELTQQPKPVSFADGFPFLLISQASLDDLNGRLDVPVPMNRFRPNLVVTGCAAFAEDTWQTIRVGEVTFRVAKPCSRCRVTTVDQATAAMGQEPLKTLSTYRLEHGQIWFGQNLWAENLGTIRVGDPVAIVA